MNEAEHGCVTVMVGMCVYRVSGHHDLSEGVL